MFSECVWLVMLVECLGMFEEMVGSWWWYEYQCVCVCVRMAEEWMLFAVMWCGVVWCAVLSEAGDSQAIITAVKYFCPSH